jgi:uncharacterized membrane protein
MENNQPQRLDKKLFIKKTLISTTVAMAFGLFLIFIAYGGRISIKPALIAIGICIVVMSMASIFAFKYPSRIITAKFRKQFLILGILIVIVDLALIIIEGHKINYYFGIIGGLFFIYYSRIIPTFIKQKP